MDKKIRQITDTIHKAIYLSRFEAEMTSTPYFYRLHDIYQTSTVYMTFPSNRTKRYEHSLGTMELASRMLFSSVSNAEKETREELFKELHEYYEEIVKSVINSEKYHNVKYLGIGLDNVFNDVANRNNMDEQKILQALENEEINNAVKDDFFSDSALDHFQFYPMNITEDNESRNATNYFLYRCLLQAVRIVALFHDVGHPPYSHIIEDVLEELYTCKRDKWNEDKKKKLENCLEPYVTKEPEKIYTCHTLYEQTLPVESKLHERIGLRMLELALINVVSDEITILVNSQEENYCKTSGILYYIMILEFTIAIFTEKNNFFKSFHNIVDGVLDADRLDYIMRDSLNSGTDWGEIPYKRLINSSKLMYYSENEDNNFFVIAYPYKLAEDIADILLMRYKIFARINFHHSCRKTAFFLQTAVFMLAEDYLKTPEEEKCINSDIKLLWMVLDRTIGIKERRFIQWNDSWLISTLHKALIKLYKEEERCVNNSSLQNKQLELKETLEEILLNKKRYYSLFKHEENSQRFVKNVFKYANLSSNGLHKMKRKICKNLKTDTKKDKVNYKDKLKYIEALLEASQTKDLEQLHHVFELYGTDIKRIIDDVLEQLKGSGDLTDYKTIIHKQRANMGLPLHKNSFDEIYFYIDKEPYSFNVDISLKPRLEAVKKSTLWLFVYVAPKSTDSDKKNFPDNIQKKMIEAVGNKLKNLK